MLPILQLGPLAIQAPGLILLIGLWLSLNLVERAAPRFGLKAAHLYNLVLVSLLGGLIGARLSYVLRYSAAFASNPASIFSLNPALLDSMGGLLTALLTGIVYAQRKKLPFWRTLDALTPGLAGMGVAVGLAHLASGAAFGAPTELPWSINLWGANRHPSQVYEIMAALAILLLTWPGKGLIQPISHQPGVYFLAFVALNAAARLLLETWRGDSYLLAGGVRSGQVAAWLILAASLAGMSWLRRAAPSKAQPPSDPM